MALGARMEYLDRRNENKTGHQNLPLFEFGVDHSVGETLAANTDAFKHTVAVKLVQHQMSVDHT